MSFIFLNCFLTPTFSIEPTFEKEILALQQEQIKQLTELNDRLEEIKRLLKETK